MLKKNEEMDDTKIINLMILLELFLKKEFSILEVQMGEFINGEEIHEQNALNFIQV